MHNIAELSRAERERKRNRPTAVNEIEVNGTEETNVLDAKLLDLLACPACENRPPVRQEEDTLICDQCHRIYPIRDGIPELLIESATLPGTTSAEASPVPSADTP